MKTGITEDSMKGPVADYFCSQGYTICLEQVPFLSRRIDLCFFPQNLNKIITVELKVQKWKDALRQARVYQLCSDEAYVVLHPRYVHRADTRKFENFGIGLMAFDEACVVHSPAMQSTLQKQRLRAQVLNYVERNGHIAWGEK